MELYTTNYISEYNSGKGVFNFDSTPVPYYVDRKPPKLTSFDKVVILLLARKIREKGGIKNAKEICMRMQASKELPATRLTRRWLIKFATKAAKTLRS